MAVVNIITVIEIARRIDLSKSLIYFRDFYKRNDYVF